jgi:NitT/TauT family transport system permease protein
VTGTAAARARQILPAMLVGISLLALWELFVVWRDIKPYLLPKPSAIWDQISLQRGELWKGARHSGLNALVGLLAGTLLGTAMALAASRLRVLREMVTPLAAAINAMPIIALTPMFNNLFSTTSTIPRRLTVTIVVFFPIFVNVLRGLTEHNPTQDELMRSFAASGRDVLLKVRLPNALPFLFTGLRVAAALCVIAAVVAEYFGGLQNGLGSRITSAAANSAYGRAWAYVAAACVLGLVFYLAAILAERLAMPWRHQRRAARGS